MSMETAFTDMHWYGCVHPKSPKILFRRHCLLLFDHMTDSPGVRRSEAGWLAFCKNKIVDYYRKLGRETAFTDLEFLGDECSHKFVEQGFWNHDFGPHEWRPEADEVMHKEEFWQTLRDCLAKLPQRIADVFMLREMDEMPSKQICLTLNISESNLWVMLHRARMALRECLEMNWFDKVNPPQGR